MVGWGDSGSHTGFGTALSGGFSCGFNTVGRLGPLDEAGQAVGLLSRTYCVSVRDRSEDLLKIRHTDGFKLNGVGALQTRACRGMEVEIL